MDGIPRLSKDGQRSIIALLRRTSDEDLETFIETILIELHAYAEYAELKRVTDGLKEAIRACSSKPH